MIKASGFDKCKPLVLNTVTDLYIRHLLLVLASAQKFSLARSNSVNDILAQDVLQGLMDVKFLKSLSFESLLDPRDSSEAPSEEYNTKSVESFKRWLQYSDAYRTAKKLSDVPLPMIHNLIDKRKVDTSSETDQERKKRRLRERQEYYNQLKQGEESTQQNMDRLVDDFEEDEITTNDKLSWLTYLAEKDLKLGHNFKFVNTSIQESLLSVQKNKMFHPPPKNGEDVYQSFQNHLRNSNKYDHVVIQIQESQDAENAEKAPLILPSSHLKAALPYNVTYPDSLMNDDIEQYAQYALSHPEELEIILTKPRLSAQDGSLEKNASLDTTLDKDGIETNGHDLVDNIAALKSPSDAGRVSKSPEVDIAPLEAIAAEVDGTLVVDEGNPIAVEVGDTVVVEGDEKVFEESSNDIPVEVDNEMPVEADDDIAMEVDDIQATDIGTNTSNKPNHELETEAVSENEKAKDVAKPSPDEPENKL